jgi:hypothetical protein
MVNVDVHRNQLYEFISIACELFTKYAGYTEEWLVFDSKLYDKGKGIRLDKLFSITPELNTSYSPVDLTISVDNPRSTSTDLVAGVPGVIGQFDIADENDDAAEWIVKFTDDDTKHTRVSKILITATLSASVEEDPVGFWDRGSVTWTEFGNIHTSSQDLLTMHVTTSGVSGSVVALSAVPNATGTAVVIQNDFVNTDSTSLTAQQNTLGGYDTLLGNYRKVTDVYSWEEGSTTGVNTLFTIEQTLAQQTYFSYAMGQYGFDLVSWYTVKEWLDTREKLLSQKRQIKFNSRTQYMQMLPEPGPERFYGMIGCYLEKPLIDVVKEQWVYQYSLALTKIAMGRIRGKYTGTSLFGGGSLNTDVLQEGLTEKESLEQQLFEGVPGFGDADPPMFFVG